MTHMSHEQLTTVLVSSLLWSTTWLLNTETKVRGHTTGCEIRMESHSRKPIRKKENEFCKLVLDSFQPRKERCCQEELINRYLHWTFLIIPNIKVPPKMSLISLIVSIVIWTDELKSLNASIYFLSFIFPVEETSSAGGQTNIELVT